MIGIKTKAGALLLTWEVSRLQRSSLGSLTLPLPFEEKKGKEKKGPASSYDYEKVDETTVTFTKGTFTPASLPSHSLPPVKHTIIVTCTASACSNVDEDEPAACDQMDYCVRTSNRMVPVGAGVCNGVGHGQQQSVSDKLDSLASKKISPPLLFFFFPSSSFFDLLSLLLRLLCLPIEGIVNVMASYRIQNIYSLFQRLPLVSYHCVLNPIL